MFTDHENGAKVILDPLARIVDPADFLFGSGVKILRVPYIAQPRQTPQT